MGLHQIIWISEAAKDYTNAELLALLAHSRANNVAQGVTGLLLYHQGSFMQFMEGETEVVNAIYEKRILKSKRHQHVTLLLQRDIPERNFANWSMGFMTADSHLANTVPGFRDFIRTRSSFLDLIGDHERINHLVDGFHAGRWHQHTEAF